MVDIRMIDEKEMCLLSLLFIVALRTGALASTDLPDVMKKASKNRDRIVEWAHGDRPVLACCFNSGAGFQLDIPADNNQGTNTVAQAALLAGIREPLACYTLRSAPRSIERHDGKHQKSSWE